MAILTPVLTGGNGTPTYNLGIAETYSWIPINNDQNRPMYARAGYITNLGDIAISLSANDLNIGNIHISDPQDPTIQVDVVSSDGYNAMRVMTQDLESSIDDVAIGDRNGNIATVVAATSSLNVNVTNQFSPINFDSFGRLRTSTPLTLFDSSYRYRDNSLWATLTSTGSTYAFNQNEGLVDLTVNSLSGSSVIRETTKVFSYQPGKSLLILNTFVMAPSAINLRQRVGYFGADNGIYFQLDDNIISFVQRSSVSGVLQETIIPLSAWNGDKLDGRGPSGLILDITKAQIFWKDIEWLGVGTVRAGLVINGQYIVCHSFHHANINATTYITTASLPLRYEITNKGATGRSSTLKQICSSVISEGGYELRGLQQAIGTPITTPYPLATAGTYYPLITLRLKSTRLDAIVILTALSFIGKTNGYYSWKVIASGVTSGGSGTWISAGVNSAVEYKLDADTITGGRTLAGGYCTTSTQGSTQVDILKEALFKFQLERDTLNNVTYELTLAASSDTASRDCYGSADWEEISR